MVNMCLHQEAVDILDSLARRAATMRAADFGDLTAIADDRVVLPMYLRDADVWPSPVTFMTLPNRRIGYLGEFFVDRALRAAFPNNAVHWVSGVGRKGQHINRCGADGVQEALVDFVVDDVQGSLTGHPGCVALIEVASSAGLKNQGNCQLTSTQVVVATELCRHVQYDHPRVPVMTVALAARLRLTQATFKGMMGQPVLHMVVRVAGLPGKDQDDTEKKTPQKPPTTAEKTNAKAEATGSSPSKRLPISENGDASNVRIAFVLHDAAAMRNSGNIWWVSTGSSNDMWIVKRTSTAEDLHCYPHAFGSREVIARSFNMGAAPRNEEEEEEESEDDGGATGLEDNFAGVRLA